MASAKKKTPTKKTRKRRVARASSPAELQQLVYAAAVEELRAMGVDWTPADTDWLRRSIGLLKSPGESEARAILEALRIALSIPKVTRALQAVVTFAEEHAAPLSNLFGATRTVVAMGELEGEARSLWYFVKTARPPFNGWNSRDLVHDFATKYTVGWWAAGGVTARKLALLSALAGLIDCSAYEGKRPKAAIDDERRSMAHHIRNAKRKTAARLAERDREARAEARSQAKARAERAKFVRLHRTKPGSLK